MQKEGYYELSKRIYIKHGSRKNSFSNRKKSYSNTNNKNQKTIQKVLDLGI